MRKLAIALGIATSIFASSPASAGNDAGLIIGGVIGGLILGDVLNDHHHNRYHHRHGEWAPVYVGPRPGYRRCETYYRTEYDPYYDGYVQVPYTKCWYTR